jgi:hypothetical protein
MPSFMLVPSTLSRRVRNVASARLSASGRIATLALLSATLLTTSVLAQKSKPATPQPNDEQYTKLIHDYLSDPRFTTDLVDHLPASATVPTPLKFLGKMPGQPGELYYSEEIYKYYEALAKASPRAKFWKLPLKTEEGRDMVVLAIGSEESIKNLEKYQGDLAALTDPRKTSEAEAQRLIHTTKPLYWITSGIHSPETGGPEMLTELAYRLIVEDTPLIRNIREHTIVFITPVVEPDGRDKQVDTYYYGKKTGKPKPPLMYWGKYVAHDNNRDGMGQALALTQNITQGVLTWHPTILHDLHEAQSYLYTSTGTGPYNPSLDPIAPDEWWLLASTEVMEMSKRNVPGVFTYGYYDGWVPNYLFWIAETHNSFGRFYEVQSYGPDVQEKLQLSPTATSREWYRTNPPLPTVKWGPRNNTNIQESAILIALDKVSTDHALYLENYWIKNKRSVAKGTDGPVYGWVIPAAQTRRSNAADMVNDLRHQGVEFNIASTASKIGNISIAPGDYLIRADQPFRTLVDMYFSLQNYPVTNPLPYDDTGWTMPLMRNIVVHPLTDKSLFAASMSPLTSDVTLPGTTTGSGSTIIVDANSDNVLVTFRFANPTIAMQAAEDDFDADGHHFHAGAFIIPDGASNTALTASIKKLGLIAYSTSTPTVKTHPLTVPRIGYVHSWQRTQDEGWVRLALDKYGVPFTYFADQKLREGHLRDKYDVIVFPSIGGSSTSQVNGIPMTGKDPIPYEKSALTPNLGVEDSSPDIRGGMGIEGLAELVRFVRDGGTLLTEGSTTTILPDYGVLTSVTVEHPTSLFTKGSIMRGMITDPKSPIVYGYTAKDLPIYFSADPVLSVSGGGIGIGTGGLRGGNTVPGVGEDITPNSHPVQLSPFKVEGSGDEETPISTAPGASQLSEAAAMQSMLRQYGILTDTAAAPRVILRFPDKPSDILLSGAFAGGEAITHRALAIDAPLGKGHVVMFALRPFWRWQTQGTYSLGFNTLLNWDHLDAGAPPPTTPTSGRPRRSTSEEANTNQQH